MTGTPISPYLPGKDLPAHAPTEDGLLPGPYALRDRIVELQVAGRATQLVLVDLWPADRLDPAGRAGLTALVAGCLRGDDWLAGDGPDRLGVLTTGTRADAETVAARLLHVVTGAVPGLRAAAGIAAVQAGPTATEVHSRAVHAVERARRSGVGAIVHH